MTKRRDKGKVTGMDHDPYGDARPDNVTDDPRANRSLPQEDVEDRENVSTVNPEDYPIADRKQSRPD